MQKNYDYILVGKNGCGFNSQGEFNLKDNPFSSGRGTLNYAFGWGKFLLQWNPSATLVQFKSENGRKIYELKREVE